MKGSSGPAPVFSRPLVVDSVPVDGLAMTIEADALECTAIAAEIDLPAVGALKAAYRIERRSGERLQVEGEVTARITQICVVTLEPFESDVAAPLSVLFAPQAPTPTDRHASKSKARDRRDKPATPPRLRAHADEEAEPPDPIVDGRIDLGTLAVEFLTLSLDFYPRKPDVHFDDVVADDVDDRTPSAFAALERFKDRT